jgi:ferredoxin--NADP+ reductase
MSSTTTGPQLVEVQMHLHAPNDPGVGRVIESRRCTAKDKAAGVVRHVAIDVSQTRLAGNFKAGQSFGVIAPGTDANGKPHKLRLYSIASPTRGEDGQGQVLATTVKRTIDEHWDTHKLFTGICSNYLCDLQVGDEVKVTGPNGKRFVLPNRPEEHDYVFVATGTGIAPFRGMVKELLEGQTPAASRIMLIMGSPYSTDLLYDAEMRQLADQHQNFSYLTAISREVQKDLPRPLYVHERLVTHREQVADILQGPRGLVYVCGIAGMELGVMQSLSHILPAADLDPYLALSDELRSQPETWDRKMIHKDIRPSRRMFLEVY